MLPVPSPLQNPDNPPHFRCEPKLPLMESHCHGGLPSHVPKSPSTIMSKTCFNSSFDACHCKLPYTGKETHKAVQLLLRLLRTAQQTAVRRAAMRPAFWPRDAAPRYGRRLADVLVVTASVRMVYRVHRHTTRLGPVVALAANLCLARDAFSSGLSVRPPPRHDADHAAHVALDHLLRAAGQLDARLALVGLWPITVT